MIYRSNIVYIGNDTYEKFFLKKQKDNIYSIFKRDLDNWTLKNEKYKYLKIEFHINNDKDSIYFEKYIYFKRGRTIFSCMKDIMKLLKEWNVNNNGHSVVIIE